MKDTAVLESSTALLERVAESYLCRKNDRRPVTRGQVLNMVKTIVERARQSDAAPSDFNYARAIRGLFAMRHQPIVMETAEADGAYAARALSPGSTPGSYLIPVIQANAIVSQLAQLQTARAAGATIWPCAGMDYFNVPAAIAASPNFVWMAANSRQAPTDQNLAQLAFDLTKPCQALILLSLQLFRTALPQWNTILEMSFALGIAEAEDAAMHASSTVANAPVALMSQSGITTLNAANNNANGGNLLYGDLLALLQKAFDLKVRPPYCWFLNGRSAIRCLSLYDTTSRPVWIPGPEGIGPQIGHLLGWPVYATASISTTEAVGSGSSQSHLVLTNPANIHVAEAGNVSLEVSTDFALDAAEVALRVGHRTSFAYSPAASLCVLQGIN